ncbi:enoyl-CoA hydratase/isomerase family protein [Aeromicrobium sp. UC242_57]|uniref:enoyl-CoA hydratase/isomerase family protein n=1 Tax=Aeromicrobium sp. UC242_57 TaxID=3374624 RepID=UPI00379B302B
MRCRTTCFSLNDRLRDAKEDPAVRSVVLAGAGDRAFCAGGDLSQMAEAGSEFEAHQGRSQLAEVFGALWDLGKPTIARVQGYALAGGCGLASACDFIVASDRAVFGIPEVHVGLWPYMITVPLLHTMAPKLVLQLMLTGRRFDAAEASAMGLPLTIVAPDQLDAAVESLVLELEKASPQAVALGRTAFYAALNDGLETKMQMLKGMLTVGLGMPDAREGLQAFAEKRPAAWATIGGQA